MVLGCLGCPIASKLAPTGLRGGFQHLCSSLIQCGSELARESDGAVGKDVARKVTIANPFAMRA